MKFFKNNSFKNKERGQLLLEILITIGVVAIVAGIGSQVIIGSLRGNKFSSERNTALGLAEETLEAIRNTSSERWQNIYNASKTNTNYYPTSTTGKWEIATGTESIVVSGITFSRSFTIQNVCRDNSTRDITGITDSSGSSTTACTISGGSPDPSTQKINVTISWPDADELISSEYITRWRNKACLQTDWSGGAGSGTSTCPANTHGGITPAGSINTGAGSIQLNPN